MRDLTLAVAMSLSACAPTSAPPEVRERAAEAPLFVLWRLAADEGGMLRVAAVVSRKAALPLPVEVRVLPPSGLTLISGEAAFRIAAGAPPGDTVAEFEFRYDAVPEEDLQLVADARGGGIGLHAVDVYRFGRLASPRPSPLRVGPAIKVGTLDLGPGVRLDR